MRYIIIALIVAAFVASCTSSRPPQEDINQFAQCLDENGMVFYGTFWCPHCANVKKMFGPAMEHIDYVECDARDPNEQADLCIEKGIEEYATMEFPDGTRLVGEPTWEELSQASGCPITWGEA